MIKNIEYVTLKELSVAFKTGEIDKVELTGCD